MCEPISAIALAGSAIAAGINYAGQQATQSAQQKANDDWVAFERKAAADAASKDAINRQRASAAEQETLQKLSPQSQQATQQTSQANLNTEMLQGSPAAPNSNVAVLGGDSADTSVTSDMAQRVTQAARAAQGRIAALAGITSYGGGYGAMGQEAKGAIDTGNEAINLTGDFRRGDTSTLGIAQQVQPIHYEQGSDIAGTVASSLAGMAGNAFMSSAPGKGLVSSLRGGK